MSMERESLIFNFDFFWGVVCVKRVCVSEKWGKGRRSKRPKRKASFCFVFITCDSLGGWGKGIIRWGKAWDKMRNQRNNKKY